LILYLDTSALVKLYVEEDGSSDVAAAVEVASAVVTARIAYAEARAAFARHRREGGITAAELRRIVQRLDQDWSRYGIVELSEAAVRRAGILAERRALRGFDALHLACALELRRAGAEVVFLSFDTRLTGAARRERLRVRAG
jgi:predicted nucleic acid-binding protein